MISIEVSYVSFVLGSCLSVQAIVPGCNKWPIALVFHRSLSIRCRALTTPANRTRPEICGNLFWEVAMHPIRWSLNALIGLLVFSAIASAQGTGDIVGRVTDTSGGVLPATTVTAENAATKISRTTITSETGDYVFTLLPIGTYA